MGLKLDAPVATNALDSSGEVLSIKGLDITDFLEGRAFANWEHSNTSEDGAVGKFIYAKKIFSEEDCETERQLMFWNQLKHEFLYGVVELFDDEFHPGAVAIAAMARYFIKNKEKIRIGMSIEGSTLKRDANLLQAAVARKAAITLTPCNKECWVEYFGDGSEVPILKTESVEVMSFYTDPVGDIRRSIEQLNKTLTAGGMNVAPGELTGGAALARADITTKNRVKAAVRDWDKRRPLKDVIKTVLHDVSDQYIDHFAKLAEDLALKKGEKFPQFYRISPEKVQFNVIPTDEARKLITGLYVNPNFITIDKEAYDNDFGQKVILRGQENHDRAKAPAAYAFLMDHYFGLADHVPPTASFTIQDHPFVAYEQLQGARMPNKQDLRQYMDDMRMTGRYYQLVVADLILGIALKRNALNMVVTDQGLVYTDNNAFNYTAVPRLVEDILPSEVSSWVDSLNEQRLIYLMALMELPRGLIKIAVKRLRAIKLHKGSLNIAEIAAECF